MLLVDIVLISDLRHLKLYYLLLIEDQVEVKFIRSDIVTQFPLDFIFQNSIYLQVSRNLAIVCGTSGC